jgi:hypothetical protein
MWSSSPDDGGADIVKYEIRYSSLEESIEGKGAGSAAKTYLKRYLVSCGLTTKYTIKGLRGEQELKDVVVTAMNSKGLVSKGSNIIALAKSSGNQLALLHRILLAS